MARVVHFEIQAEKPERAVEFYRAAFDWEFTKWEGPEAYWLITTGPDEEPGINGGLMRRQTPIDGESVIAYVCSVEVPSIDDTAELVTGSGGEIVVPKMPIPGVGWLFYAKDPEGNIFGVTEPDPEAR